MTDGASLLAFLGAPLLVGDPEGRVIYANPAFEERFGVSQDRAQGEELASMFAGGGREAVLAAVAQICNGAEGVRFKLREEGRDYLGMASPIAADEDAVGVLLLLTDEPERDPRLHVFQHEVKEPLDEVAACLESLQAHTGGRRGEALRDLVDQATAALERAHKWNDELLAVINGERKPRTQSLDPVRVLREAARRVADEYETAGVSLDTLFPNELPAAVGEEALLETALVRMLRHRLAHAPVGQSVALTARTIGSGAEQAVLITVVSPPVAPAVKLVPSTVPDTVGILGGRLHHLLEPSAGAATGVRLAVAS